MGRTDFRAYSGDAIALKYRVLAQEVPPNLVLCTEKSIVMSPNTLTQVSFTFRSDIQEQIISSVDVANNLESDFRRRGHEPKSPETARQRTKKLIIKSVQACAFREEMASLQRENKPIGSAPLKRESRLFQLSRKIDEKNCLGWVTNKNCQP